MKPANADPQTPVVRRQRRTGMAVELQRPRVHRRNGLRASRPSIDWSRGLLPAAVSLAMTGISAYHAAAVLRFLQGMF